jgi:hypothetical protein
MLVSQKKKIVSDAESGDQAVGECRRNKGVCDRSKKCEAPSPFGVKHTNHELSDGGNRENGGKISLFREK